jgi:hypothetical protein
MLTSKDVGQNKAGTSVLRYLLPKEPWAKPTTSTYCEHPIHHNGHKGHKGHNVRLWVRQKLTAKPTTSTNSNTPFTTMDTKFPELPNVRQKLMGTTKPNQQPQPTAHTHIQHFKSLGTAKPLLKTNNLNQQQHPIHPFDSLRSLRAFRPQWAQWDTMDTM